MEGSLEPTWTIGRCDPAAEKLTLALAALAWPEAERPAYWHTMQSLLNSGQADQIFLLAARLGDRLVASQLGQLVPGNVAVVWPPQFASEFVVSAATAAAADDTKAIVSGRLFAQMTEYLAASGANLAQALLHRGDERLAALFVAGGFTWAADLLYMMCETRDRPIGRQPLPFRLEPFTDGTESRLAQIIDRTYAGTLDCPQLDGLRDTADVIVGYKAVGRYDPALWKIIRDDNRDVGCLLLNVHPDVSHAEIIYLALVPEARGRGWGLLLAKEAQRMAAEAGCERLVLAVDAANLPATRLYSLAGFRDFDRRAVWICKLAERIPK